MLAMYYLFLELSIVTTQTLIQGWVLGLNLARKTYLGWEKIDMSYVFFNLFKLKRTHSYRTSCVNRNVVTVNDVPQSYCFRNRSGVVRARTLVVLESSVVVLYSYRGRRPSVVLESSVVGHLCIRAVVVQSSYFSFGFRRSQHFNKLRVIFDVEFLMWM